MRRLLWIAVLALQAAVPANWQVAFAATPAAADAVTRDFLLGEWTDTDDCSNIVEFRRDGTFETSAGALGVWALIDGRIIFQGERTIGADIVALGPDTVELTQDDGSRGRSTRCTARQSETPVAATRAFLIGAWTDIEDCEQVVEFLADGSFVTSEGAEGRWRLEGDRLVFIGHQTVAARVQAVDEDTLILIHDDETLGRSTRCSGSAGPPRRIIAQADRPGRRAPAG